MDMGWDDGRVAFGASDFIPEGMNPKTNGELTGSQGAGKMHGPSPVASNISEPAQRCSRPSGPLPHSAAQRENTRLALGILRLGNLAILHVHLR